jgi:predicted amidohydrolase YtcJ
MNAATPGHERALLVLADRVHTMATDQADRALLVRGGFVVASGEADALRRLEPDARVLDLAGTVITPGLTDAHLHLTEWALARQQVDLADAASPLDAARLVAERAGSDRNAWVLGRGWNAHLWHGAQPHRSVLDSLFPDRPVALQSHDMHALWVNSTALRAAGVTDATGDVEGGTIVRDEDGPVGLLLESAGQLIARVLPVPGTDALVAAVRAAQAELHTLGITGIHSFPGIHTTAPAPIDVLHRLRADGELRLRVLHHFPLNALDAAIAAGERSGAGDPWIRTGGVKMFLDGALGSRTAWMRSAYEDGSGFGMNTMPAAEFHDTVRHAAHAGIASTVHAIGDAAVCLALDVLGQPDLNVAAMPHRIEHMQCCPIDRLGDAAAAGLVCSMQPSHLMTDWSVADTQWGRERSRGAFALAELLRHRTVLAFGSDAPVEPVDPRRGLHAAVHRTDADGRPAGGWFPEQRIRPAAALAGYTIGPARAAGLPAPAGTLAAGAVADFAVWERDPLAETDSLLNLQCVATFVNGHAVHS